MNFEIDYGILGQMDLHMHTVFSDGSASPAEMVSSAVSKGFRVVGVSDHSYTYFDESYCIKKERIADYIAEITMLKENADISVYCGIEQDYYSRESISGYDFVIGSVHYIQPEPGAFIPVDETAGILKKAADDYFDGDMISLCEEYFRTVGLFSGRTGIDIIGHFDLVSKFNEGEVLFSGSEERYKRAWREAADKLIDSGHVIFEINTGAVLRGYRSSPYPSEEMISYIKNKGGKFIFSSDAHSPSAIGFGFPRAFDKRIKEPGF